MTGTGLLKTAPVLAYRLPSPAGSPPLSGSGLLPDAGITGFITHRLLKEEIRMAKFICDGCGKCCRSFGAFIVAERQLGTRDYYCRYGITNEIFLVHVEPEYADAIADAYEERSGAGRAGNGMPCIFLQEKPDGKGYACAIYPSRPEVCRDFRCYRMLIYRQGDGKVAGTMVGKHDLRTEDEVLKTLWKEKIAPLPYPVPAGTARGSGDSPPGDREWITNALSILAAHGYRGDPVED